MYPVKMGGGARAPFPKVKPVKFLGARVPLHAPHEPPMWAF